MKSDESVIVFLRNFEAAPLFLFGNDSLCKFLNNMEQISEVSIINRYTINSSKEESWKSLGSQFRLGSLDQLVAPFIPIAVIFAYEQSHNTDFEIIPIKRIKLALSILLDHYPHLTGRLQMNETDGFYHIDRLGSGADFLEAKCQNRLDSFTTSGSPGRVMNFPGGGNELLPPYDQDMEVVSRGAVLTMQHTRFACGGVAVGIRLPHMLCDADGYFQLVRDLAEIYRDLLENSNNHSSLTRPPHIRPYMCDLRDSGIGLEERDSILEFEPSLFYLEQTVDETVTDPATKELVADTAPPVVGRFVRFTTSQLEALKQLATNPNDSNNWVSTFDALSAHFYQRVYQAKVRLRASDSKYGELSRPDYLTPINLRNRLGPEFLAPQYSANSLLCTYTHIEPEVLLDGPLWKVAKVLHNMARSSSTTSKEEINNTLKWIALQPDMRKVRQGFQFGSGSFMVSQWNKFDMYSAVFDSAPILVSPPFTPISLVDGLAYFLPTEDRGVGCDLGAIDVSLSLSAPIWDIIDRDSLLDI